MKGSDLNLNLFVEIPVLEVYFIHLMTLPNPIFMSTASLLSCNTSSLAPYVPDSSNPWNEAKAKHVFRRLGYGANQNRLNLALTQSPSELIDSLVDSAANAPLNEVPSWGYFALSDFENLEVQNPIYINDFRISTGNNMVVQDFKGRMILFWLNHFVTELEDYTYAPYLFQYYRTAEENFLGNFKTLTFAMGLTPAMLFYLNGFQNTNEEPNENYARELFELFTLGEGNGYTQDDIVETSKALTGYNHWDEPGGPIYFDPSTFYDGDKTIFGQTGNWDYQDVINLIFNEKQDLIAPYICRKLYKYFVSPDVDAFIETNIIEPMAQTFIDSNFELVPVLKELFKSEHFFDERALGVTIKSPLDLIFQYVNETGFYYDDVIMQYFVNLSRLLGQGIFEPPDVAGWQGDEEWINTSTLTGRWASFSAYLNYIFDNGFSESFRVLAKDLSNDSIDPVYITQVMVDFLLAKPLFTQSDYDIATDIFKWEIPQNYYDEGLWNLDWEEAPYQVLQLLIHIATWPEFQLK